MRSISLTLGIERSRRLTLFAAVPILGLLVGCTSEKIVFRDRAPFNEPVAAAQGFLGFFSVEDKQTTCGNCHVDKQADWVQTKHASAWEALPATAGEDCKSCHSTNARGNTVEGLAGYEAVKDSIYHDVQCESCHGPGLTHVRGVGQANIIRPLAKLTAPGDGTCADCHGGNAHVPFVEEWSASGHAKVSASRAANEECERCHDGRGALESWGVETNYQERDVATAYQPTTCSVCHNPHGSANTKQLRFAISSRDPEQNLCMKCHMRRIEPIAGSPTESSSQSPHAPQGAMLLGLAGYRPSGFVYPEDRIFSTHGSTANPRLCAGCHVNRFTVNDQQGGFVFQSTGHLFRPIPCLDPQGKPTGDKTCEYSATARSWASCTQSGCHGSAAVAVSAFTTIRARMKLLTEEIWKNANTTGTANTSIDAPPKDTGLLPTLKQTRPAEWTPNDGFVSPAEGAEFNARLCGEYGSANSDNSKGVHNPFLCEALLIATINELRSYYGLPAPPATVQAILDGPIGGPFAGDLQRSKEVIPGYELKAISQRK